MATLKNTMSLNAFWLLIRCFVVLEIILSECVIVDITKLSYVILLEGWYDYDGYSLQKSLCWDKVQYDVDYATISLYFDCFILEAGLESNKLLISHDAVGCFSIVVISVALARA